MIRPPTSPPRLVFSGSRSLYLGPAFELSPHRNGVAVLCLGIDGQLRCAKNDSPVQADWIVGRSVLVPAGILHRMAFDSRAIACLYLDPSEAQLSKVIDAMVHNDQLFVGHKAEAALIERVRQSWNSKVLLPSCDGLSEILGLTSRHPRDGIIRKVLGRIAEDPAANLKLNGLSADFGLSASRLRHRFKHEIGIPFSRYRLWRRIGTAMRLAATGATLTHAAHAAGFASSAHFSVAFRNMFGIAPSSVTGAGINLIVEDTA